MNNFRRPKKGEILNFTKERAEEDAAATAGEAADAAALIMERIMVKGWKKRKVGSVSPRGTRLNVNDCNAEHRQRTKEVK